MVTENIRRLCLLYRNVKNLVCGLMVLEYEILIERLRMITSVLRLEMLQKRFP